VIVEPDVAKPIVCACNSLLDELRAMVLMCERIGDVKGMGTLKSGQDLAAKFSKKAVGGEDSLEKSLTSHIQVVTEMRDLLPAMRRPLRRSRGLECLRTGKRRHPSIDTKNLAEPMAFDSARLG